LSGPYYSNSEDIAKLLIARGVLAVVHDAPQLAARLGELLSDDAERARIGKVARESIADNRGSLAKLLRLIEPLLAGA
jgi:3-deoxy-D-manno-octulosonic-acid transferase